MIIKKTGGKIFGADLTSAERKALDIEIQKQFKKISLKHAKEVDAIFLWQLHVQLGFGPKRLKRFYKGFASVTDELSSRYEMEGSEQIWLYTKLLKDYGVDLDEWRKEKENGLD